LPPSLENATVTMTVTMTMNVTATMTVMMTINENLMDVMGVMSLSATMCEQSSNEKRTGEMMPNAMMKCARRKKSENRTSGSQLSVNVYRDALTHSNSWCSHHSLL
jgi:hypothetical protein